MRALTTIASLLVLSSLPATALASTATGYVANFTSYNSAQSYACAFQLSSSSSSTSGTTYIVDDVAGEYGATCLAAMLAEHFNQYLTVYYLTSGSSRMVEGVWASSSGNIPTLKTNDYTGTSSADRCLATMNTTSGVNTYYVDDSGTDDDITCGLLALMQFRGSASWTVNHTSYEINYLYGQF
jgi:hypothetical protein